ncbi:hypothetical protein LEP1GSC018_3667 [Leptospira kirschneri str. 2008720114]|nr:hypothetical protein LEP1GSC018_3667 [Leptospira kirschneri str. 2008720114]
MKLWFLRRTTEETNVSSSCLRGPWNKVFKILFPKRRFFSKVMIL